MKEKLDKKSVIFIAMGSVIIVLLIVLIIMVAGKNDTQSPSETATQENAVTEEQGNPVDEQAEKEDTPEESNEADSTRVEDSEENAESEEAKESAEEESEQYHIVYDVTNSWDSNGTRMSGLDIRITNQSDKKINGWKLVLDIRDAVLIDGWNGTYVVKDNNVIVTNADYNKEIYPGGSIVIGCNVGTESKLAIAKASLNGAECQIKQGTVDKNAKNEPGMAASDDRNGNDNKDENRDSGGKNQDDAASVSIKLPKDAVQGDDWLSVSGNKLVDRDGKEVWITGVNWFGYNTGTNTFDGLWASELKPTVKEVADHGFNLIRVPISAELINQWAAGEYPQANYNQAYNEELNSMNSLQIFDYFLQLAEENGIKVMPDIHSAQTDASGHTVNLWYTDQISVKDYYAALEWMAKRYKDNDTIIAYDLKNEPHGKPNEGNNAAIWNDSKSANNWKYVAETAAAKVLAQNPNVLILVEGTEIYPKNHNGDYSSADSEDYYFNWWGGNLRGVKDFPVNLGKYQNKLVYSPHDYGPTVYAQPWFEGKYTYSSLMKDCWRDNWFYIYEDNIAPLHIGEWGGFMKEPNLKWMKYMRQLIKTYRLNHTFWCLNGNSGDTGGLLLDDFTSWDTEKYNFVKEVLWQKNGKFVGLDHAIALGKNGISLKDY